jgi:hypothetical protein
MGGLENIQQPKVPYLASGIVFGAAFGMVWGLLLLDGNISGGLIFGASMGLVFGLLLDVLHKKIFYSLIGLGIGLCSGAIFGVLFIWFTGSNLALANTESLAWITATESIFIGAVSLAAIGLVIGTMIGLRKMQYSS